MTSRVATRCVAASALVLAGLLGACGSDEPVAPAEAAAPTSRERTSPPVGRESAVVETTQVSETASDQPDSTEVEISDVANRAPIAGFKGLDITSTVVYRSAPERPQKYRVVYVFPDRARLEMALIGGGAGARWLLFRIGSELSRRPLGSPHAVALADLDARIELTRIELRRALFLWPDGFEWERQEDGTSVATVRRGADAIATLRASLDAGGELKRIDAALNEGRDVEALVVIQRQTLGSRTFPKRLELHAGGQVVWDETVDGIETRVVLRDDYFRPASSDSPGDAYRAVMTRLPSLIERVEPLTGSERSLTIAIERAAALRAELESDLPAGTRLDPSARFDLDASGRPTSVRLALIGAPAAPPGWVKSAAGSGTSLALASLDGLERGLVEAEAALPDGRGVARRYLRVAGSGAGAAAQLVLVHP